MLLINIELKTKKGRLSPYQKHWIEDLNNKGYLAQCCKGVEEAMDLIDWYLR